MYGMTINISLNSQQRAALGLSAIFIMLSIITLFYSIWQWRHDWMLTHAALPPSAAATSNETGNIIASLPDRHLFGQTLTKGDVPISNLQLTVTGIVKSEM